MSTSQETNSTNEVTIKLDGESGAISLLQKGQPVIILNPKFANMQLGGHSRGADIALYPAEARSDLVEVDDRVLFPLLEPVIAGNEDVVFVSFAVAIPPLVILRAGKFHPVHQASRVVIEKISKCASLFWMGKSLLAWRFVTGTAKYSGNRNRASLAPN